MHMLTKVGNIKVDNDGQCSCKQHSTAPTLDDESTNRTDRTATCSICCKALHVQQQPLQRPVILSQEEGSILD